MCEELIESIEINQKEKNIIKVPKYSPSVKISKSSDCEPISQDILNLKK